MQVVTIGATTCGKPYASTQAELIPGLVAMNILDARSVNANGEGDFYEGLPANCEVLDDPVLPFTDPDESLIAEALFYTENNRCAGVSDRQVLAVNPPRKSELKIVLEESSAAGAVVLQR